jgi:hypothetical protein
MGFRFPALLVHQSCCQYPTARSNSQNTTLHLVGNKPRLQSFVRPQSPI